MLHVTPMVMRESKSMIVMVDSTGMWIRFGDYKTQEDIFWNLTGYPTEFMVAAKKASGAEADCRFTIWPDHVKYVGSFSGAVDTDMPELRFTIRPYNDFYISLRRTEIANVYDVIHDYWTC